jgi:hypothetical protein
VHRFGDWPASVFRKGSGVLFIRECDGGLNADARSVAYDPKCAPLVMPYTPCCSPDNELVS